MFCMFSKLHFGHVIFFNTYYTNVYRLQFERALKPELKRGEREKQQTTFLQTEWNTKTTECQLRRADTSKTKSCSQAGLHIAPDIWHIGIDYSWQHRRPTYAFAKYKKWMRAGMLLSIYSILNLTQGHFLVELCGKRRWRAGKTPTPAM